MCIKLIKRLFDRKDTDMAYAFNGDRSKLDLEDMVDQITEEVMNTVSENIVSIINDNSTPVPDYSNSSGIQSIAQDTEFTSWFNAKVKWTCPATGFYRWEIMGQSTSTTNHKCKMYIYGAAEGHAIMCATGHRTDIAGSVLQLQVETPLIYVEEGQELWMMVDKGSNTSIEAAYKYYIPAASTNQGE